MPHGYSDANAQSVQRRPPGMAKVVSVQYYYYYMLPPSKLYTLYVSVCTGCHVMLCSSWLFFAQINNILE